MVRGLKLLHGLMKSATVVFGFTEPLADMWACEQLPETTVSRWKPPLLLSQPPGSSHEELHRSQVRPTTSYCERGTRRLLRPTPWWSSKYSSLFSKPRDLLHESTRVPQL
jgi:hypothetical protein